MSGKTLSHPMYEISLRAPRYQSMMFGRNLEQIGLHKSDLWTEKARPALSFILRYHAFARAGGEQAGYGDIALSAIDALSDGNPGSISGLELWKEFKNRCEGHGIGINKQINKGLVIGLSNLAMSEGNLFLWMERVLESKGRLSAVFEKLESICGIGRKIATFIIRDVIWFLGMEDRVIDADLKFLQPIDRWVRRVGEELFSEFSSMNRNEIASQLALKCKRRGVSNAEFNQGAWYLSRIELGGDIEKLEVKFQ